MDIPYLNRIRKRTVTITHDGRPEPDGVGVKTYDIISDDIDDPVLAAGYFQDKTNVVITAITLTNNHATDALLYDFISNGRLVFGEPQTLTAESHIQLNSSNYEPLLGEMIRDGQGNYFMPEDAQATLQIKISSESQLHDATLHLKFLVNEV